MKKILCFLFCVYLLLSVTPFSFAAEYDSINVNAEIVSQVQDSDSDTVVTLYNGYYTWMFAERMTVQEMVASALEEYYMVISPRNVKYRHFWKDGELYDISLASGVSDWSDFISYALSPEQVFGPSVEIYNIYCLDGQPSYDLVYIYYVTSEGDYVLFKEHLSYEDSYLVPVEDFYEIAEIKVASYNGISESGEFLFGGSPLISELCDLTPYIFHPKPTYGAYFIMALIILSITAVCVLFIVYRKKREIHNHTS